MKKPMRKSIKALLIVIGIFVIWAVVVSGKRMLNESEQQWDSDRLDEIETQVTLSPVTTPTLEPTVEPTATPELVATATPISEAIPVVTKQVSLIAVGDDLVHTPIITWGKKEDGSYQFDGLFDQLRTRIEEADLAVINQETVLGGASLGYSGYPRFNSPTEIGDAIVRAGFDVVLHATNHAMDKGEKGLQNTIEYWKEYSEIAVLGINETEEQQQQIPIVEKNGIKIAMLNYTYSLNGLPMPTNRMYMVNMLEEEKIRREVAAAKEEADFVIVYPHWGTEYVYEPSQEQQRWTSLFLELEVDLVIGTHPHVLEPVEWLESETGHKMLVYYSLGNYVSYQQEVPRMLGGLANITISKTGDEKAKIVEAGITPIVTHYEQGGKQYGVYPLNEYSNELAIKHQLSKTKGLSVKELNRLANTILGEWYQQ